MEHVLTINKNDDVYYHLEIIVYPLFMELECSASGWTTSMAY